MFLKTTNIHNFLQDAGFIEQNKDDRITDWSQLQKPDIQPSGIGASIGNILKTTGIVAFQNFGQSLVDAAPKRGVTSSETRGRDCKLQ